MKIILWIVGIWILIGLVGAVKYSATYDPKVTSFPNDSKAFMINVIMGPIGFL